MKSEVIYRGSSRLCVRPVFTIFYIAKQPPEPQTCIPNYKLLVYCMQLDHVGVINKSEEQALKFYRDFLGLEKTKETLLAPELSEQLFSLSKEIKVMVFEGEGIKIEVFISDFQPENPNFTHFSIMVDSLSEITERADRFNVDVIIGRHKDKTVCFIKDFSGNLIEVKQRP